jgi:phage-related protein
VDQGCAAGLRGVPGGSPTGLLRALTVAAEGGRPDIAKPLRGLGSGVFEVALQGIKTPARDVELVKSRLKSVREMLL